MIWKHREFVDNILRGSMNYNDNPMKSEVKNLLSMIVNFKHTQDLIFTTLHENQSMEKQERFKKERELSLSDSQDESYTSNDPGLEETRQKQKRLLKDTDKLVKDIWKNFLKTFMVFLELVNQKPDMKSLAFKLDFNEYYKYKTSVAFDKSRGQGNVAYGKNGGNLGGSTGGMDLED